MLLWHRLIVSRSLCGLAVQKDAKTKSTKRKPWQLTAAVCLERPPLISQEMPEVQSEYAKMVAQIEAETGLMSDHEMRVLADKKRLDAKEIDVKVERLQTAQDFEDAGIAELKLFQPAARITEADHTNDLKSLKRALDRKLVLVVQQKLGETLSWVFPTATLGSGETLLQTGQRALSAICPPSLQPLYFGNAPCGVYSYDYPRRLQDKVQFRGSKTFFFKAQLPAKAKVELRLASTSTHDFLWLSHEQLREFLHKKYFAEVRKFLIE